MSLKFIFHTLRKNLFFKSVNFSQRVYWNSLFDPIDEYLFYYCENKIKKPTIKKLNQKTIKTKSRNKTNNRKIKLKIKKKK